MNRIAMRIAACCTLVLVSVWPASAQQDGPFLDRFEGDTLDPVWSTSGTDFVFEESQGRLSISGNGFLASARFAGAERVIPSGDFDVRVDYQILDWSTAVSGVPRDAALEIRSLAGGGVFSMLRSRSNADGDYYAGRQSFQRGPISPTSDTTGTLRITRTGTLYTAWYWDGSSWVSVFSRFINDTGPMLLDLSFFSSTVGSLTASVAFDNAAVLLPSDDCATGVQTQIDLNQEFLIDLGTASSSQSQEDPVFSCRFQTPGPGGATNFFTVVPTTDRLRAITFGFDQPDTLMALWSGTCGSLVEIACSDDQGPGLESLIDVSGLIPGQPYVLEIATFDEQMTLARSEVGVVVTGGVLYVDDDAQQAGADGVSWQTAFDNPEQAIERISFFKDLFDPNIIFDPVSDYTEVRIAQGRYVPTVEDDPFPSGDVMTTKTFLVDEPIRIEGGFRGAFAGGGDPDSKAGAGPTVLSGDVLGDDTGVFPNFGNVADNVESVMTVVNAFVDDRPELIDLTIERGSSTSGNGAGIEHRGGELVLDQVNIRNNTAMVGGGLFSDGTEIVVRDSMIQNNVSSTDAGGADLGSDLVTISNTIFDENIAERGGGAFVRILSTATLRQVSFSNNTAFRQSPLLGNDGTGGGIHADGDVLAFDSLFTGNRAGLGGGLYSVAANDAVTGERVEMQRCLVLGNYADIQGGGLDLNTETRFLIDHTVIASNSVANTQNGSGMIVVSCEGTITNSVVTANNGTGVRLFVPIGPVFIRNTIMANNGGADVLVPTSGDGPLTLDHSLVQLLDLGTSTNTTLISLVQGDPGFVDPIGPDGFLGTGDEDYRLLPGSRAIDAGNTLQIAQELFDVDGNGSTSGPITLDLGDAPRVTDDAGTPDTGLPAGVGNPVVDIGAFEFQGTSPCPGDVNRDGSVTDSDFFAWVTAFINEDPECDVNRDGACSDSDFFAWVTAFISGC
ncbi:MAG: GC-type dockerin domain-anchored protein [Planctomycetota bacterium]